MAHIVKRNKSYAVVYGYKTIDGQRKQKWETYYSEKEAFERKYELENLNMFLGIKPYIRTLNQLLDEYIEMHGQLNWSMSTYTEHVSLMTNYIRPHIGSIRIVQINRSLMSRYFQKLQNLPRVANKYKPNDTASVGNVTLHEIHKLLRSVFQQAINWGYMEINPVCHINLPAPAPNYKKMLSTEQVLQAINSAVERGKHALALMIQLAFVCSMRKGEIHGLMWGDIDFAKGCIQINKELTRVDLKALRDLNYKGVYHVFPPKNEHSKSRLVLKEPKTSSSVRTVYLPKTVADSLQAWRQEQEKIQVCQVPDQDYGLVFGGPDGYPLCMGKTSRNFKKLLSEFGLSDFYFHSLRYFSTSYKLILSQGDIKAVQGDNGHAQPDMVLSVYALIQAEQRKKLADQVEADFCLQITPAGSK